MSNCYACNALCSIPEATGDARVICFACNYRYFPDPSPYHLYVDKHFSGKLIAISGISKWCSATPIVTTTAIEEPPTESELASLRLVAEEKHWRVEYSRLERLINKGWLTALGTTLTKAGKALI